MKKVYTTDAPLPFSNVIVQDNVAYVAGQVGFDEKQNIPKGIEAQTDWTIKNLKRSLEEAGFKLEDVVKVGAYLVNNSDFPKFNEIYASYFKSDRPVRTTIFCKLAKPDFLVEIDAIAAKNT